MTDEKLAACPSCRHKPAVLYSAKHGWVVMCLRWNCQAPKRTTGTSQNRGDVVRSWNEEFER